ncbi:hypothetical protein DFQ27_005484 [Actinomortierella ambigua]|uniref:Uncharacterized protein n=1 Tax=Actinomortierella ambigua TaxID=1343610 RepID=A0A9P6Q278_9FUNG|nr:hypothetical protein DFQ27_005484 [Actinomortierella ambigua]
MPIQLTSNCCLASNASPADEHLGSLITFNKLSSTQGGIEPVVVRQCSPETTATEKETTTTAKTLLQLAPRNPAVALTVHDHEAPFRLKQLVVISSARTIEVYRGSGDYLGTFQGEPWSPASDARSSPSPSPSPSSSPSPSPSPSPSRPSSTSITPSPAATKTPLAIAAGGQGRGDDARYLATAPLFRIQIDSPLLTGGPIQGLMVKVDRHSAEN